MWGPLGQDMEIPQDAMFCCISMKNTVNLDKNSIKVEFIRFDYACRKKLQKAIGKWSTPQWIRTNVSERRIILTQIFNS